MDVAPDITVPATLLPVFGVGKPGMTQVNYLVGRLRIGVSPAQAMTRLAGLWRSVQDATMPAGLSSSQQEAFRASRVHVETLEGGFSFLRPQYVRPLSILGLLAVLLLLLTCANLSGLALSRAAGRAHELAVRAAIGATRGRLATLLVVESLVLAAGGLVLAVPFGWWTSLLIGRTLWTDRHPLSLSLTPDWRVVTITGPSCSAWRRAGRTYGQPWSGRCRHWDSTMSLTSARRRTRCPRRWRATASSSLCHCSSPRWQP